MRSIHRNQELLHAFSLPLLTYRIENSNYFPNHTHTHTHDVSGKGEEIVAEGFPTVSNFVTPFVTRPTVQAIGYMCGANWHFPLHKLFPTSFSPSRANAGQTSTRNPVHRGRCEHYWLAICTSNILLIDWVLPVPATGSPGGRILHTNINILAWVHPALTLSLSLSHTVWVWHKTASISAGRRKSTTYWFGAKAGCGSVANVRSPRRLFPIREFLISTTSRRYQAPNPKLP